MSPRAACRLATLGFERVYDFTPGKVDWMARGELLEGEKASDPRATDLARQDVVTCDLTATMGQLRDQVESSPYGAFVLGDDGVLLGRLRKAALNGDPDARAQDVMEPGPSTTRPRHPARQAARQAPASRTHHRGADRPGGATARLGAPHRSAASARRRMKWTAACSTKKQSGGGCAETGTK